MSPTSSYHTSVMLYEAVDGLDIKPDGVYVDATFGGGGHSRLILERLGENGRLLAFDQDEDAWSNLLEDKRLIPIRENFRYLSNFLRLYKYPQVDGILADLGVSSHQFDTAERGFSIRFDGPLDMRMDQRQELTAAQVLKTYSEGQLQQVFEWYGEVRNARQLAKLIVANRTVMPLDTIASLKALVEPVSKGNPVRYLAQLFQALRIEVNEELQVLKDFLEQAAQCLKPGGRLSVITFHSLEDRLVKQFIKNGTWREAETDVFGRKLEQPLLAAVNAKPIEASVEELKRNSRSRSARLRVAYKLGEN